LAHWSRLLLGNGLELLLKSVLLGSLQIVIVNERLVLFVEFSVLIGVFIERIAWILALPLSLVGILQTALPVELPGALLNVLELVGLDLG